ncbi:LPD11 domain-containing protein [Treponema pectinovorum]|uniref:LPD11 domain-containing protein n=1 Tax=Treponema pectinovorum TaxID=164 RepID=UPI001C079189|nr:LPD11 domain-containing protein [Treponema pectinovorum]
MTHEDIKEIKKLEESFDKYKKALKLAYADGDVTQIERNRLISLKNELGLSDSQAMAMEARFHETADEDGINQVIKNALHSDEKLLSLIDDVKVYHPENYGYETDEKFHLLVQFHQDYENGITIKEDNFYSILQSSNVKFKGKEVDFNPIDIEKSGTIKSYLNYQEKLFEKENYKFQKLQNEKFEKENIEPYIDNPKFRYMLLSRMIHDCEYYLNYGNRSPNCLWSKNEENHIKNMVSLYNSFSTYDKPSWISAKKIHEYSKEMTGKSILISLKKLEKVNERLLKKEELSEEQDKRAGRSDKEIIKDYLDRIKDNLPPSERNIVDEVMKASSKALADFSAEEKIVIGKYLLENGAKDQKTLGKLLKKKVEPEYKHEIIRDIERGR